MTQHQNQPWLLVLLCPSDPNTELLTKNPLPVVQLPQGSSFCLVIKPETPLSYVDCVQASPRDSGRALLASVFLESGDLNLDPTSQLGPCHLLPALS